MSGPTYIGRVTLDTTAGRGGDAAIQNDVYTLDEKCLSYRTRANKGRGLYSKNIFWAIIAANNQERLLFENYFSHKF